MDTTHLLTHKDTHDTVKRTRMFMIANLVAMVSILAGSVGWILYANSSKKWPYKPYIRKSGPHGSVNFTDYVNENRANTNT
jgi:hypothetical protein